MGDLTGMYNQQNIGEIVGLLTNSVDFCVKTIRSWGTQRKQPYSAIEDVIHKSMLHPRNR